MSEITTDNNSILASLFSTTDLTMPSFANATKAPANEGFVNLLDLIQDTHVADSQDTIGFQDWLQQKSEGPQLKLDETKKFQGQMAAMMSEQLMTPNRNFVGQDNITKPETASVKIDGELTTQKTPISPMNTAVAPVQVESILRGLQGKLLPDVSKNEVPTSDLKSEQAWGLGFASGDIQQVLVVKENGIQSKPVESKKTQEQMSLYIRKLGLLGLAKDEGVPERPVLNAVNAGQGSEKKQESAQNPFEKIVLKEIKVVSENNKDDSSPETKIVETIRTSKDNGKTVEVVKKETLPSGEFLLSKMYLKPQTDNRLENVPAQQRLEKAPFEVIQQKSLLGMHNDVRVSPESLKFVSEKIDALKTQGGGQLKVLLTPKALGQIEIKVNYTESGTWNVDVKADRPDTLAALKGSQGDLDAKLSQIPNFNRLEISQSSAHSLERGHVGSLGEKAKAANSEDLLQLRGVRLEKSEPALKSVARENIHNLHEAERGESSLENKVEPRWETSQLSRDTNSPFQGESREDARERALRAWHDEIEKKQIA